MAITAAINESNPDGATQLVRDLDNSIRDLKRDIRERMEESIIDTGVTSWSSTTAKVLAEGTARVFTNALASRPAFGRDGRLFIENAAPSNTDAFQYDTGAAWVDVPIGTDNLLADAVTTVKILNNNVTLAKIAAGTFGAMTSDDATADLALTAAYQAITGISIAYTPDSATSVLFLIAVGTFQSTGSFMSGSMRIRSSTGGGTTLHETRIWCPSTATTDRMPATCIALDTGSAAPRTYTVEAINSGVNGIVVGTGDAKARLIVVELKKLS